MKKINWSQLEEQVKSEYGGLLHFVDIGTNDKVDSKSKTLEEFIHEFFELNEECYSFCENQLTTGAERFRSAGDIYLTAKYYFPETTLEEVISFLYNIKGINSHYCRDIDKRVYYIDLHDDFIHNSEYVDELGLDEKYYSGLSDIKDFYGDYYSD